MSACVESSFVCIDWTYFLYFCCNCSCTLQCDSVAKFLFEGKNKKNKNSYVGSDLKDFTVNSENLISGDLPVTYFEKLRERVRLYSVKEAKANAIRMEKLKKKEKDLNRSFKREKKIKLREVAFHFEHGYGVAVSLLKVFSALKGMKRVIDHDFFQFVNLGYLLLSVQMKFVPSILLMFQSKWKLDSSNESLGNLVYEMIDNALQECEKLDEDVVEEFRCTPDDLRSSSSSYGNSNPDSESLDSGHESVNIISDAEYAARFGNVGDYEDEVKRSYSNWAQRADFRPEAKFVLGGNSVPADSIGEAPPVEQFLSASGSKMWDSSIQALIDSTAMSDERIRETPLLKVLANLLAVLSAGPVLTKLGVMPNFVIMSCNNIASFLSVVDQSVSKRLTSVMIYIGDLITRCYQTKSLKPLLYLDPIMDWQSKVREFVNGTDHNSSDPADVLFKSSPLKCFEYGKTLLDEGNAIMARVSQDGKEVNKIVIRELVKTLHVKVMEFHAQVGVGRLQAQPFCAAVVGDPRIGKTGVIQLVKALVAQEYGLGSLADITDAIATIVPGDKYQSNVGPNTKMLIVNDVAKQSASSGDVDINLLWLQFIDNNRRPAVKADVTSKGKVFPDISAVIVTSNSTTLDFSGWKDYAWAHQRVKVSLRIKVNPKYLVRSFDGKISTSVDWSVVTAAAVEEGKTSMPDDLYLFSYCVPDPGFDFSNSVHHTAAFHKEIAVIRSVTEMLVRLRSDIRAHKQSQKVFLTAVADVPMCKECQLPSDHCLCEKHIVETEMVASLMPQSFQFEGALELTVTFWFVLYATSQWFGTTIWKVYKALNLAFHATFVSFTLLGNARDTAVEWYAPVIRWYRRATRRPSIRELLEKGESVNDYLDFLVENRLKALMEVSDEVIMIGATLVAVFGAYKMFNSVVKPLYGKAVQPMINALVTSDVKQTYVTESVIRKPSTVPVGVSHPWNVRVPLRVPETNTTNLVEKVSFTLDDFRRVYGNSIVRVSRIEDDGDMYSMFGLIYHGDFVIFPSHLVKDLDSFDVYPEAKLWITKGEFEEGFVFSKEHLFKNKVDYLCHEFRDICMLSVPGLGLNVGVRDLVSISDISTLFSKVTSIEFLKVDKVKGGEVVPFSVDKPSPVGLMHTTSTKILHKVIEVNTTFSEEGDCGLCDMFVCGSDVFLAGMHVGKARGFQTLEMLHQVELDKMYLALSKHHFVMEVGMRPVGFLHGGNPDCDIVYVADNHPKCYILNNENFPARRVGRIVSLITNGVERKFETANFRSRFMPLSLYKEIEGFQELFDEDPLEAPVVSVRADNGVITHPFYLYAYNFSNEGVLEVDPMDAACMYLAGYLSLSGLRGIKKQSLESTLIGQSESIISNPVNLNTSMGMGYSGKKKKYIFRNDGEVEVDDAVLSGVDECIAKLRCGPIRVASIATFKDEPIKRSKNLKRGPRVFFVLPAVFNLVVKMYVESILNFMVQNSDFFWIAIGMNMPGLDCERFWKFLKYGVPARFVHGDYGNFDQRLKTPVLRAAVSCLMQIAVASCGYSEDDLTVLKNLLISCINHVLVFKGDMFDVASGLPSGIWLTSLLGCLCNVIMVVCVYLKYVRSRNIISSLRDDINVIVMGDDHAVEVSLREEFDDFNFEFFKATLEEMGMKYDTPNKDGATYDFVEWSEVEFLKRRAVLSKELGFTAPLDDRSLVKMTSSVTRNPDVPLVDQVKGICISFLLESFLKSRYIFNERCVVVERWLLNNYPTVTIPRHILDYDLLKEKYLGGTFNLWDYSSMLNIEHQPSFLYEGCKIKLKQGDQCLASGAIEVFLVFNFVMAVVSINVLQGSTAGYNSGGFGHLPFKLENRSVVHPGCVIEHRLGANKENDDGLPSLSAQGDAGPFSLGTEEQVAGVAGTATHFDNLGPVVHVADAEQVERGLVDTHREPMAMQNILNTWTLIGTHTWASTSGTGTTIASSSTIFYDYLTDARVSRKISNFYRFSGVMELMFMVNCSPTTYGHAVFSVYPYVPSSAGVGVSYLSEDPALYNCFQGRYIDIVPSVSEPGVIELPWAGKYSYIQLKSLSSDETDMWRYKIFVVAPLASAMDATATPTCSIRVYARMKELTLDIPFAFEMKQASKSKASSVIKSVSDTLGMGAKLPFIGSSLEAASIVGKAVGSIAETFGFSKVTTPNEPTRFRGQVTSGMANVDGVDTSIMLGLQSDNAVSIDSAMSSSSAVDELAFADFFKRKTLVTTYVWSESKASGDFLFSFPVSPMLAKTTGGTGFYVSPMGLVGTMFNYWRGSIVYEFKVYASSIHRGRLQIVYMIDDSTLSDDPTNVSYSNFLDVNVTNTSELVVGWASRKYALNTGAIAQTSDAYDDSRFNGMLKVYVSNPIEAKGDGDYPVVIEVYTYATEDLRMYGPRGESGLFSFEMMKTKAPAIAGAVAGQTDKVSVELVPVAQNSSVKDFVFGEEINSVRALFQKFYFDQIVGHAATTSTTPSLNGPAMAISGKMVDLRVPKNLTVSYASGWNDRQQQTPWDPFSAIPACFLGWRGSLRYKLLTYPQGDNGNQYSANLPAYQLLGSYVSVIPGRLAGGDTDFNWMIQNDQSSSWSSVQTTKSFTGYLTQYYSYSDSSGFEFTVPYYQNARFVKTARYNTAVVNTMVEDSYGMILTSMILPNNIMTAFAETGDVFNDPFPVGVLFLSGGTDFSLVLFKFVPPVCNDYAVAP